MANLSLPCAACRGCKWSNQLWIRNNSKRKSKNDLQSCDFSPPNFYLWTSTVETFWISWQSTIAHCFRFLLPTWQSRWLNVSVTSMLLKEKIIYVGYLLSGKSGVLTVKMANLISKHVWLWKMHRHRMHASRDTLACHFIQHYLQILLNLSSQSANDKAVAQQFQAGDRMFSFKSLHKAL